MKIGFWFLLFFFCLVSCSDDMIDIPDCPESNFEEPTIHDLEVYRIVDAVFRSQRGSSGFIHLYQRTSSLSPNLSIEIYDILEIEVDPELLNAYVEINETEEYWSDLFSFNVKLFSKDEYDCLSESELGVRGTYINKYPDYGGFLVFGIPVYNEMGQAIVSYDYSNGSDCALYHVELEKRDQVWRVINQVQSYVC